LRFNKSQAFLAKILLARIYKPLKFLPMDSLQLLIGKRLKLAREGSSRSQEDVAYALGLKDRQSVSAIEVGARRITPEELIKAADFLGRSLAYFTDPYVVAEKNAFSFRAKAMDGVSLDEFSLQAERLISAQRRFRNLLGETASPHHQQLRDIGKNTPFPVASACGEQTARSWGLGAIPTHRLRETAEEKLGISIFYVDANPNVSGAACHLDDGDVILINRQEPEGRRNFNIGHELFHLLTWDEMPPEAFDLDPQNGSPKKSRCEQLADCYANGLLMPPDTVRERWAQRQDQDFNAWLHQHSVELLVSRAALYWRLVNLNLITKEAQPFPNPAKSCTRRTNAKLPNLYNREFVRRVQQVLAEGHLSVIRATEILDSSIEGLVELFESYQMEVPFGY
jgi:XRE family transcriptional regulator, fatty acid utilization regulator